MNSDRDAWLDALTELANQTEESSLCSVFQDIMRRVFGIEALGLWLVGQSEGAEFQFQEGKFGRSFSPGFTPAQRQDLKENLQVVCKTPQYWGHGLLQVPGLETGVNCHLYGNSSAECQIVFWKPGSHAYSESDLASLLVLFQCQLARVRQLADLREHQYQDELTGLYNQKHLDRILEQELRRGERLQTKFAVVFLDLDNFKHINDNHGHLVGSSILKQFGDLLRDTLRDVDSIIRYGGDEYVVILLGADSYTAWQVSERIRSTVAAHVFAADGTSLKLTCSMGIACYPEDGMTKESLLKAADQQMYLSKEKGKNLISARSKQPQISGLDDSWMTQRIKQRRKT